MTGALLIATYLAVAIFVAVRFGRDLLAENPTMGDRHAAFVAVIAGLSWLMLAVAFVLVTGLDLFARFLRSNP